MAPLFVRDRYGSNDSMSTVDDGEHRVDNDLDGDNPWAGSASEKQPASSQPEALPVDGGTRAWVMVAAAFAFQMLLWGE